MRTSSTCFSLFLLFLFALNLYNYESRIILIVFLFLMLFSQRWILPITSTSIFLSVYSLIYYIFAIIYNPSMMTFYIIPFLLAPFMGYTIGIILMQNTDYDRDKLFKRIIYIIIFGRFAHGLLNFMASDAYSGYMRNGVDFWTKSTIAATGQGALMTMAISLLFYGVFVLKKNKIIEKIAVLTAVVFAVINSLLSASRTALIIMIIVLFSCVLCFVVLSNIVRTTKTKIILCLITFFLVVLVLYQNNIFGIKTYWETSPLYERINTESDYQMGDQNRAEMITDTLKDAWNNPLGSGDMSVTAHNFWLDALRQTGWITFVLLVIFTIVVVKNVISLLRARTVTLDVKCLAFSVVLGTLLNFSVEPIMKGMPYYFTAFCVIAGAIEEYQNNGVDLVEGR